MTSNYYDSCIFGNATNPAHSDYQGCVRATDIEQISRCVALCPDIIRAELPSVAEFVDEFLVYCELNGVTTLVLTLADSKFSAKQHRAHKKVLEDFGFLGHDWNHLMAAVKADSDVILTTDEDFFDPRNKSARSSAKKQSRVSSYISREFGISVRRP
jgi:hypothetical protein